ncbi:hypothetical protein PhaeoP72_04008 (plasmid) [Phaeobacter inhibens]|uniref:hypothetical protein n=1 Tax=Phaeobacter inhibens TaxID=221822 RepID=UPI000C9AC4F2|nr:hypothetical protein [Phaeobacter inhibens]AUR05926.1 hypothetical protein PhaeoP72_04008 [Phaeobacter inhibens]
MAKTHRRHDHTAWITHFVRDRSPEQDFPGEDEEEYGYFAGGELEADAGAFQVLTAIIRLGGLMPGYSFRKGRTTIYGGQPAVCATEMPLYAFATYARERAAAGNVSAYGISFLKSEFYAAGGRPAIYGLSTDHVKYARNDPTCRIIDEAILPVREQFRFIAHNPGGATRPIDWSHEREWRWVARDGEVDNIWVQDYNGIYGPVPALPLFKGHTEGRPFSRVCIIVWSVDEAKEINELLTGFYLAGSNNYDSPFDKQVIQRSRIIVLEEVIKAVEQNREFNAQTIEGLEKAQLLRPITIASPPKNAAKIVAEAFAAAKAAGEQAGAAFNAKHGNTSGSFGFAHAATSDVTSPIVQYLLASKQASGPFDGEVWLNYSGPHGSGDIDYAEEVCRAAAKVLAEKLGIEVYVSSALD